MSLETIAARFGDRTPIASTKEAAGGLNLTKMTADMLERIDATLVALQRGAPGPMAKRYARKGWCVKVGYGSRNVRIVSGPNGEDVLCRYVRDETEARAYLLEMRAALKDGAFDAALGELLASFQERAERARQARQPVKLAIAA